MPARDHLSAQLRYRYTEDGGRRIVNVMHPDKGIVGHLSAEPQDHPTKGLSTSLIFVHPDLRRKGIGTAMYNVLAHQVGYRPTQDSVRTPLGDKWAKSTGAVVPPRIPMKQWDMTAEQAEESVPERQMSNWMRGESIDPTVSKALTPVKPKRKKKGPKYEQLSMDVGNA